MDAREKALRLGSLTEMLVAYGQTATPDRLKSLGNLTKGVPVDVFREACQLACIQHEGGWPPGPGDVIKAALQLAPGEVNPGQARSLPRWYRRATFQLRGGLDERPREIEGRGPASILELAKEVK